jgi:hypothetical protein
MSFLKNIEANNNYYYNRIRIIEFDANKYKAWLPIANKLIPVSISKKEELTSEMVNSLILKNVIG